MIFNNRIEQYLESRGLDSLMTTKLRLQDEKLLAEQYAIVHIVI